MPKIKFLSKIVITLILILLITEVLFRFVGFALLKPQATWNSVELEDSQKLRILTLGESTTAEYFSDPAQGGSWPRVLQNRLNSLGVPARVYNEAVGGTTTGFLVANLPNYLELYRPHIVISMMGINDVPTILLDESWASQLKMGLTSLRVVKLGQWLVNSIQSQLNCKIETYSGNLNTIYNLIDEGMAFQETHSAEEVKDFLQKKVSSERDVAFALTKISVGMRGDMSGQVDYKKPRELSQLAFKIFPYDYDVAFWHMNNSTPEMCKESFDKLLPCGNNIPDAILSEIIVCANGDAKVLNHPAIRSRGLVMAPQGSNPVSKHYQMMIDILRQRNIQLVAMQYPTLNVESLKQVITENGLALDYLNGIRFVSNEANFAEALKKNSYEKIFKDRFRGSWGHTTQLGYDMIADSVLQTILEMWKSGCCRMK